MKTSELIAILGKENLLIYKNEQTEEIQYIRVFTEKVLSDNSKYVAEIGCVGQWVILRNGCPKELSKVLINYNYTPLEEREEEKRYYLKTPNVFGNYGMTLNRYRDNYLFAGKIEEHGYKTKFTQKEIDIMPFDTKFFIKEEVVK